MSQLNINKIIAFCLLIMPVSINMALSQELYVQKLKNSPSNEVYQIFEDKKGYLWMGTNEGLYSFDGKNYTSFLSETFTNSVSGIQQDKEGRIWCSNFSGQVFYVEGNKLKLFHDYSNEYLRFPTYSVLRFPEIISIGMSNSANAFSINFNTNNKTLLDEKFKIFGFNQGDINTSHINNDNENLIISNYRRGNFTINSKLELSKIISPQNENFKGNAAFIKNNFLIQTIIHYDSKKKIHNKITGLESITTMSTGHQHTHDRVSRRQITNAVNKAAKAKGYTMVFDSSSGTLVYAMPQDDITKDVARILRVRI